MEHHAAAGDARRVARQLVSSSGRELIGQGLSSSTTAATAAAQLQQKHIDQAISIAATRQQQQQQQQRDQGAAAPAGPMEQAHMAPAAAAAAPSPPGTTKPKALQQASPPKPQVTSNLASATTSQGPIIMDSVEGSVQAQQAMALLNSYDFKIYGQGLMAGPQAVPLSQPGRQVLYAPTPEPPQDTQPSSAPAREEAGRPAVLAPAAAPAAPAAPAVPAGVSPSIVTSESGTSMIPMQPLPHQDDSSSSSSSFATPQQQSPFAPAAEAAAAAPAGDTQKQQQQQQQGLQPGDAIREGASCQTFDQAYHNQVQQQQQQPLRHRKAPPQSTAAAAAAAASRGTGLSGRRAQAGPAAYQAKQPGYQAHHRHVQPAYQARRQAQPQAGKAGGVSGRLQRLWQSIKAATAEALEDAAAWLLHMLWLLTVWLVRLLLVPIKAVFGPWYQYNRRLKASSSHLLSQQLDLSALQEALGALPSWLSGLGGATETLGWLNTLLAQVWPVLDPVVCALIRSSIEPLLSDMKPPFIAALGFQKLTLGELPVVLEGIRVVGGDAQGVSVREGAASGGGAAPTAAAAAAGDDRLEVEVDFHWVGEPNISFFVEMALAGPYTRLVPKVSHLTSRGTLRLGLTRLVPQLPGFGAIMISLARSPQVKFTLDFGPALGGKFTAKPVAAFLDPFLRDTLANMVVWPNRIIVPMLPRSVTGNLDDLALHSVGVLEVEVCSAHSLPKKGGPLSTVDPQVEVWTQPQHRVHSAVKKGSRNPSWRGQHLEVLVQEPDSQQLRVIMHDIDMLNLKELLRVNLLKGAANLLRSANPIGRAALPLRDICAQPFKRQQVELKLSGTEWAYELGVIDADDTGSLSLGLTYKPFQDMDASSSTPIACRGVLFVDVRQCQDLLSGDWDSGSSDPYVLLKVAGQKQQTVVAPHTSSPTYAAHFEFFNVQVPDVLEVQVWDRDYLKPDDLLGQLELPVASIITWSQGNARGLRDGWWRLHGKNGKGGDEGEGCGRIEMKIQYRPYSS